MYETCGQETLVLKDLWKNHVLYIYVRFATFKLLTTFNDITNIKHMYFFNGIFDFFRVKCKMLCVMQMKDIKTSLKILTFYITDSRQFIWARRWKLIWILNYINHNWNRCVNDGLVIKLWSNMRFVYKQFRMPESCAFITFTAFFKIKIEMSVEFLRIQQ